MDARGAPRGRGRGRAPRGRGRGLAPRGRGRGLAARGRGRGEDQDPAAVGVAGGEPPVPLNLDVPVQLLNQTEEINNANRELSRLYKDMDDLRETISLMRDAMVPDRKGYDRLVQLQVDVYQEMRANCRRIRNRIRRMAGGGIPFEEPDGFDVMP